VRVPEQAATGVAKAKLSFPGWKDGAVEPASFDVTVVDGAKAPATPAK
jgi:hypothetical protein